jgi:hypothetical protein
VTERPPISTPPRRGKLERWMMALAGLATLAAVWGYFAFYPRIIGKAQPIAFSHRVHAGDKKISCVFCHSGAIDSPRAGVPPLETCMLCHSRIIIHHPEIEKLRAHYEKGTPVLWQRANDVPEFVFFNHEMHVLHGFDCGKCHGDVAAMDRIVPAYELTMGFCVQCHRDENFSHDCLVCHR